MKLRLLQFIIKDGLLLVDISVHSQPSHKKASMPIVVMLKNHSIINHEEVWNIVLVGLDRLRH